MADIRILTGRPGRLLRPVIERIGQLHERGERCLLLVPEQFTLQAERELMSALRLPGFFTISVLSPTRLYHHVLQAAGRDEREPLDDAGRQMAVACALERCELSYYQRASKRRGFPAKAAALLRDVKQGGLTHEALADYARALPDGVRRAKLCDLAALYAAYEQRIEGLYSDGEDQRRYVAQRLARSGLLDGAYLFVYGFDTLPEPLSLLLASAAPLCERLTVALLCDGESAPDGALYAPVRRAMGRFATMLDKQGCPARFEALPAEPLPAAPAIRHLDEALFARRPKSFEGDQRSVFLSRALSPFEEASLMSREILRLVAEGVSPERVAVLYPDQNGYAFAVTAALQQSGLPFYTDRKLPALTHGLTRYLLGALRAMAGGCQQSDMLAMLSSGYAPMSFEERCELERYALSYGIDRARWRAPFTRGEDEERERCEALRQRLTTPLDKARAALVAAKDARASLEAVFTLLTDVDAYGRLQKEEEALLEAGFRARASQNSQIWRATLQLFDQLYRLSGSARIPLRHIAARLECGYAAISLSALPPARNMLHAGVLGHTLPGDMEAVFILGLNDGVLQSAAESLLTEDERARTQTETGAFLGLTDEDRAGFARLDVKRAMALPSRLLYLSCAKTAPDGSALRPLSLLGTLENTLFHGLPELHPGDLPLSSRQALSELGARLRLFADGDDAMPRVWRERLSALLSDADTARAATRVFGNVGPQPPARPLRPADARRLYGDETLSVSRLEQFAECPFKHFVAFGLRPVVRRPWKVDAIDTGVFYHEALHRFARLARGYAAYPDLSDEETAALADAALSPMLDDLMQGPMGDGPRSGAQFERAKRTLRRAAVTMTRQLAAGRFSPYRTEASFGYPGGLPPIVLLLSDGREVMLRGRIDRIDRYASDEGVYLRVIDYKSSRHDLSAAKLWWGLQLQLLLYLDAALSAVPGALPAGAFYFYVGDPLVESADDLLATVEEKLCELLRLKGVALCDVEVLRAMDESDGHVALSPVLDKKGDVRKDARALSADEMRALLAHARQTAAALAQSMLGGEIAVSPARSGSGNACQHCECAPICGFDESDPDAPFRDLPEMSMDALRERLRERA